MEFLFRNMKMFRARVLGTVTAALTVGLHSPCLQLTWVEMAKFRCVYFSTASVRDEINIFNVCDCVVYLVKYNVEMKMLIYTSQK